MKKNSSGIKMELLAGFENQRALYVHDLGGVAKVECQGADNYSGEYQVTTRNGHTFSLTGKPAFFFVTGLGYLHQIGDEQDAKAIEERQARETDPIYVDDPEAIAPVIRMIIHAREYIDRLGDGRERVAIELPLFPNRQAALDYLHQAQVHAFDETWEGFDKASRHWPYDDAWMERLRKMGL